MAQIPVFFTENENLRLASY